MGSTLLAALLLATPADAKTYYLDHAPAEGLVAFLDGLVEAESEWVEGLGPHWEALKRTAKENPGNNSLSVTGAASALKALEAALKRLDVPRTQIEVKAQRLRVKEPAMLLGKPADPPTPGSAPAAGGAGPLRADVAIGEWADRVAALVESGDATVFGEPWATTLSGHDATVFVAAEGEGDPDIRCLRVRPSAMEDGAIRLAVSFGRVVRDEPGVAAPPDGPPGEELCEACGPGPGDWRLITELTVSALVPAGESVLLRGLKWYVGDEGSVRGPADEFIVISAEVIP